MKAIQGLNVYRFEFWTVSYAVMCIITLTSLPESCNFQKQVGSKSTPKFAIGSTVDSSELVDTERLQRGLLFSMKVIRAQSTWM